MESWAHQKNIERLQSAVLAEKDGEKRRILQEVLAGERARLGQIRKERPGRLLSEDDPLD